MDRCEEMVVVDGVVPKSAAEEANIKKVSSQCASVRGVDSGHQLLAQCGPAMAALYSLVSPVKE